MEEAVAEDVQEGVAVVAAGLVVGGGRFPLGGRERGGGILRRREGLVEAELQQSLLASRSQDVTKEGERGMMSMGQSECYIWNG